VAIGPSRLLARQETLPEISLQDSLIPHALQEDIAASVRSFHNRGRDILCPGRLRHAPRQFSWIDQCLVRDRHIQVRSPALKAASARWNLLTRVRKADKWIHFKPNSSPWKTRYGQAFWWSRHPDL
jgi:hypothetical protein